MNQVDSGSEYSERLEALERIRGMPDTPPIAKPTRGCDTCDISKTGPPDTMFCARCSGLSGLPSWRPTL